MIYGKQNNKHQDITERRQKMKLEVTQKLICLTMAGVMTMTSGITAFANQDIEPRGTVYHKNQKLTVTNLNVREPIMKSNGYVDYDNFAPAQVSWTNPTTKQVYQAYCVNPAKPGYGDTADYDITVEKFDGDCIVDAGGSGGKGKRADSPSCAGNTVAEFLEGAVNAGYPTVKAETLFGNNAAHFGVSQERLNYAAYLATKMAIWSGIHNNYGINTWSQNEGAKNYPKPLRDKVVAVTKSIYQKAAKYKPSSGKSQVTLTAEDPVKVEPNYEVVIKIGNTQNNVAGADMSVEMAAGGRFTDGLKICDMKGSEYPKKTTSSNNERYTLPANVREFKAILPEPSTPEYKLTKEIRLFAEQNKKILLYGRTSRPDTQNYILAGGHMITLRYLLL